MNAATEEITRSGETNTNTRETVEINDPVLAGMFNAGAHYGLVKARRHPSTKPFIYGTKDNVEIFDLEKVQEALREAQGFIREVAARGKRVLFVSSKHEAANSIVTGAESIAQPYVIGRWVGGTLTNFGQIRKRVEKFDRLTRERDKGELVKYTKKEQLLISREIEGLEEKFGGIIDMTDLPGALFVIDPRKETIAVAEAHKRNIPVVALANSDCNLSGVEFAIPANDASRASIAYFTAKIVEAYKGGQAEAMKKKETGE
jgi:small subunit ribosomal protein S2